MLLMTRKPSEEETSGAKATSALTGASGKNPYTSSASRVLPEIPSDLEHVLKSEGFEVTFK